MKSNHFWAAASKAVAGVTLTLIITLMLASAAVAQSNYKVLHKFETETIYAGLTFDAAGNLYGTTFGNLFQLTPNGDGTWKKRLLHSFTSGNDVSYLNGTLIFDAAGNLYGTTLSGGDLSCNAPHGCGTVFELTPESDGSWTESVLHTFNWTDGAFPFAGVIFDAAGNLYSTTTEGGAYGLGTVFQLTPNGDGTWNHQVLHSFNNWDGNYPTGLIFDHAGNFYGTTVGGGSGGGCVSAGYFCGTVFQIMPNGDGTWTESVLHSFQNDGKDGQNPFAGLIFDSAGNLYGTTSGGGTYGDGTGFKLKRVNGGWKAIVLHAFDGKDGQNPTDSLIFDQAQTIYGTTSFGGAYDDGTVFKLKRVNGGWKETVLHSFRGKPSSHPWASVIFDAAGNLYGTTGGGATVYEITP